MGLYEGSDAPYFNNAWVSASFFVNKRSSCNSMHKITFILNFFNINTRLGKYKGQQIFMTLGAIKDDIEAWHEKGLDALSKTIIFWMMMKAWARRVGFSIQSTFHL